MVVRNPYFKFLANNITPSILEELSLEKSDSNIKVDALFLYSLIREAVGVGKLNAANCDNDTFATTFLAANSRENLHFRAKIMPLTNTVPAMTQVKVLIAGIQIPTLI